MWGQGDEMWEQGDERWEQGDGTPLSTPTFHDLLSLTRKKQYCVSINLVYLLYMIFHAILMRVITHFIRDKCSICSCI